MHWCTSGQDNKEDCAEAAVPELQRTTHNTRSRYSFLLCLFSYSLTVGLHTASKYIYILYCTAPNLVAAEWKI